MEKADLTEVWHQLSESVFEEVATWRKEHPIATFKEIEADLAQQSQRRDWSGQEEDARPRCPQCGSPLQARGTHERKLAIQGGGEGKLTRRYGTCPQCGSGFFPPG